MLISLTVENYALIDRLEMQLDGSLNIITGETGAGKSILLGALGLLLGGKNDGAATRDNTKSCVVEAQFSIEGLALQSFFEQNDLEYEAELTVRRVITASGKSRSFIGDIPVSLTLLRELGERLIDIHSQHQNQVVGDEAFRIRAVDALYDSQGIRRDYEAKFAERAGLIATLREVESIATSARRDEEWLQHQVEELTAANLREGEAEEAEAELQILENAEEIGEVLRGFEAHMSGDERGGDEGMLTALKAMEREMEGIAKSFPQAKDYSSRLRSIYEELKDMSGSVSLESESIEANPERLAHLGERIDTLYGLQQKHRARDIAELIEIRDRYTAQLSTIQNSDERIAALRSKLELCEQQLNALALSLTKSREGVASMFANHIEATLHRLGMEQARFELSITPRKELSISGGDHIEFLFSSVAGRTMQGVEKIGSGGEISRVMLAIKALLCRHTSLPTIIFDEIDTGVSGRIADAMGEIIFELSHSMQIIDITHLPQVASKGHSHFSVYKDGNHTNITRLTPEERVQHIATMLSGSTITEAALTQAAILLRS